MAKQSNPWFKFYPRDWLEDTRSMTLEQRGAYMDCIAIIMDLDQAIPDDVKWLAHKLHVSTRKAKSIRDMLVEAQKLIRTNSGFDNEKCREVRMNRKKVSKINSKNAKKKKIKFELEKSKPDVLNAEPELNQSRTSAEPTPNQQDKLTENSEKTNKNNDTEKNSLTERCYTRAGVDADIDIEKIDRTKVIDSRTGLNGSEQQLVHDLSVWIYRNSLEGIYEPDAPPEKIHVLEAQKLTKSLVVGYGANAVKQAHAEMLIKMSSEGVVGNPLPLFRRMVEDQKFKNAKIKKQSSAQQKIQAIVGEQS